MTTFYTMSGNSPPTEPTLVLWRDLAEVIGLDLESLAKSTVRK